MEEKEYSVSEAVRLVGVESHVLRYWEEELHVPVGRSAQGHRMYSEHDIELFRRTKELKDCGIQLKAIRLLFEGEERLKDQKEGSEAEEEQEAWQIAGSVWKLDRLQPKKETCVQAGEVLETASQSGTCAGEKSECKFGEEKNREDAQGERPVQGAVDGGNDRLRDESAEKWWQEERHQAQDADAPSEEPEPPVYEIIPDEKKENMRRFEAILKRLIAEVVEEQNEKLEKVLCETIQEEAANLFELYQSALEEAAAEREAQKKHWIRAFLERCFGKR